MHIPAPSPHLRLLLALSFLPPVAHAQTKPPAPAPAPGGDTVKLSVFQVVDEKDLGYAASTALSGTRTNEKLENLPNSISVMTQEFMQDLAFNNYFDAVGFATNAENIVNNQGTVGAIVDTRSGNQVSIRGLASIRQLRDGFPWYLPADVFNTERIEFSRGPGGLAYGDVDAGGIINIASKRATFQRRGSVQIRYDNFGTRRYSLDVTQPVVADRLAVRVNAIRSEVEQFKQRTGRDLEGYAASLRWEPFKDRRTRIDAMVETGNTTNHIGHLQLADQRIAYVRGTGTTAVDANPNLAGIQANGVGMRQLQPVGGPTHSIWDIGGTIHDLQSTATQVFRISAVNQTAAAVLATDPQNPNRFPSLPMPESILSPRDDWGGPDCKHNQKYTALTAEITHAFSDKLNALLSVNRQTDDTVRKQSLLGTVGTLGIAGNRSVYIDVNPVLPNPNGAGTIPNPNFEKLFTAHNPALNPDGHDIVNVRGQAVYDAALPWGITQRIVLGATYRHEKYYIDNFALALAPEEIARRGFTGAAAFFTNSLVYPVHYLADGNNDARLGWNVRPGVTQLFRTDAALNRRLDQSLTSGALNLLGSYFGGRVRTSLGLSRDHWLQSANAPLQTDRLTNEHKFVNRDGTLIANSGVASVAAPLAPFADEWSTNVTYGAVWHAHPLVSLTAGYFESSQFADNYGLDLNNNARAPLNGEGVDASVRLHLWDKKIEASATWFTTVQENLNTGVSAIVRDEINPLLNQPLVNLTDYRDRTAEGWEYQVLANVTRQWTLIGSYSNNVTEFTRFFPLLGARLAEARANARTRGLNPDDATLQTRMFLEQQEGAIASTKRATGSVTTRYRFIQGAPKGFTAGLSAQYNRGRKVLPALSVAGVVVVPASETDSYIWLNPFFAYQRKVGRTAWTLQLNINNLLNDRPNQGNVYISPRYLEPRQYVYTTTVSF